MFTPKHFPTQHFTPKHFPRFAGNVGAILENFNITLRGVRNIIFKGVLDNE